MYLAKRTKFLFPNKSANSDPDQDDDFGKSFDISKTYLDHSILKFSTSFIRESAAKVIIIHIVDFLLLHVLII